MADETKKVNSLIKKIIDFLQLKQPSTWLLLAALTYVLWNRIPAYKAQTELEGMTAPVTKVYNMTNQEVVLPLNGAPSVLIFWATWCGPCTLELKHVNAKAKSNEINLDRLFVVSSGEPVDLVNKTSFEREYKFQVFADPNYELASYFKISGTPTTVFLDKDAKVVDITTGVGPLLAGRIAKHTKSND